MIDVKKLITGFLVLAVACGATAMLISAAGNSAATNATDNTAIISDAAAPATADAQQPAPIADNAFLPQPTDSQNLGEAIFTADDATVDPAIASATDAMMSDPNNLTGVLANSYLNNLAIANPNGAQDDGSGDQTLTPPDPNAVIADFASSSPQTNIAIPDWEAEAAQIPVAVVSSSQAALESYGTALGSILSQNIVQTDLQNTLNNNTDPSVAIAALGNITTALQDIGGLQTPTTAVALQKSIIKTLVYTKNELALLNTAQADPLKTAVVVQAEDANYQSALQDLQTQLQTAQSKNLFSFEATDPQQAKNGVVATLQSIFGVPTAHAQWAVFDPVGDAGILATVANMIKAEVKDIILQLLKNSLVFIMQKTIFSAIQGSGAPGFIQSWAMNTANAFQQTALNSLNSQMACVGAAPFAPQLRLLLRAPAVNAQNNACAVQFQSQLTGNNLTNFYNNFNAGGFTAYLSMFQPSGNIFGAAMNIQDEVKAQAVNSANAAKTKSIANQGFHGSAVCDDGSNPNGQSIVCQDNNTGIFTEKANGACPNGTTMFETISNDGTCMDGTEPEVQTPGTIAANMVNGALDGNFKLITSATSWEGLASGLFISILQETLNSLAKTTIAGANGLLQQAFTGGGSNGVTTTTVNGVTTYTAQPATGNQSMQCLEAADTSSTFTFSANGGQSITTAGGITVPIYNWTVQGTGAAQANTDTFTTTFPGPGTYTVTVTDGNAQDNVNGVPQTLNCAPVQIPWAPPSPN